MMTSELLVPLTWRAPSLAEARPMHEGSWPIGEETTSWARSRGLVIGDADTSRLGRGRFERLSCRLFPEASSERVALFARWMIWLFAFDDLCDETPFGGSATSVDVLYEEFVRIVRRGEPRPGADPLAATLAELWQETAPGMGAEWRRRFRIRLGWHRQGCLDEAVGRRTGTVPGIEDYPWLRRRTNAPFVQDLVEPILGVEVPEALVRSRSWQRLLDAVNDVTGWCNDIASYPHETGRGEEVDGAGGPANQVSVAARELELDAIAAIDWVNERIVARMEQAAEAAGALADEAAWRDLEPAAREGAGEVAATLLAAPRAHLDWLVESGRYSPMPDPSAPSPRRIVGVTLA